MRDTRYHCTEDEIRIEHPEAERIEGTLIERWIPETPEEVAEHDQAMKPAVAQRLNPDGSVKKHWEP
jgi:hypothetical protein